MSRTSKQLVERAAWWRRKPWPCVVLGVDPAAAAGAALAVPNPPIPAVPASQYPSGEDAYTILWAREVSTNTRALEDALQEAVYEAHRRQLQLVLSLESWGSGGRIGINQWLGMGEAVGAWKRALQLMVSVPMEPGWSRASEVLTSTRSTLRVQQTTWRSWMVEESGERSTGKFIPFDSEGWKRAATRACAAHFPYLQLEGANAAEAALLAAYTMRSDELGRLLPATYLRKHGFEPLPPEEVTPRKGKRRGSSGR